MRKLQKHIISCNICLRKLQSTSISINLNSNQPQLQSTSTQHGCDTEATQSCFKFQFEVPISSFNSKFQFQVSISCFNLKFQFQVSILSFSFKFQFHVSSFNLNQIHVQILVQIKVLRVCRGSSRCILQFYYLCMAI